MEQLGTNDAPGIIFTPDSNISIEISESPEFRGFIKQNEDALQKYGKLNKSSTYFKTSANLFLALGHADILFTQIDKYGNLYSIILDTYDFNQSTNPYIAVPRNVQDNKILTGFYTLIYIFIPHIRVEELF